MGSFSLSCAFAALAFAAGCSSSSPATSSATGGDASTASTQLERGASLVKENICASCHGAKLSGSVGVPSYPNLNAPNITPDSDTGIGGWTDAQIKGALVSGVDDEGATLCAVMPTFTFSESDVAAMIAYLRSIPAVSNTVADSDCPADGGK